MLLNPYQKIVKNGELIQPGDMDTPLKFQHLTQGVDLKGKSVLDVGCNLGMMCHLAMQEGAIAKGIDINRDYIEQARELFPEIEFNCSRAEDVFGNYDYIIASGMLHYVDIDKIFKAFARCSKQVLCDIWLHDSKVPIFALTHRNIYIPSRPAFYNIVSKYFNTIEEKCETTSPDQSRRFIFHLSDPKPDQAEAVVIYGQGNTGKTTLAKTYPGYKHFMTDDIFISWKVANISMALSVAWNSILIRGHFKQEYIDFCINSIRNWLIPYVNRDIVIEGYDLVLDDVRGRALELLSSWHVTEIELKEKYE